MKRERVAPFVPAEAPEAVGADLDVMDRDSRRMRGDGPFVFAQVRNGEGVAEIADHVLAAWRETTGQSDSMNA